MKRRGGREEDKIRMNMCDEQEGMDIVVNVMEIVIITNHHRVELYPLLLLIIIIKSFESYQLT